ncbi:AraC family transcriptional regulator [Nocardioides gansuensis]|uniref:AraC family transcriptional regulator n=1 Tax=Nocardioides gansuensis TaxID=2138300 RepID=A0A2T8F5F4_9ACTN|nr:helix-turn-helix domain-containing protein [Nocardioides gansuensis]PVG80961.1 AraC family transcriptional regulator [Nocardioides gansuensis]
MTGRDRLRELLDAVLAEDNNRLAEMAGDAYSSPFHFSREVLRGTGESPVALRRRVMLERAGWQLASGTSVTEAAFVAGYGSVDGFSRAFARAYGHPPRTRAALADIRVHWLSAPNGVHFHPPLSLWVHDTEEGHPMELSTQLIQHDVDDTLALIEAVSQIPDEDFRREVLPGNHVLEWDGEDSSAAKVLDHQVWTKEVWVAAFEGTDFPQHGGDDPASLRARHEGVTPRWLAVVRDIERRRAWGDRLIDALCDPPESFQIGSVIAHVVTYGAHRRQLVRLMLRASGHEVGPGDPITWMRDRLRDEAAEETR